MGVPIVQGRGFSDADNRDAAPVAIVSESVARRYWPGQNPLGKRLRLARDFAWVTVVGVAADVRYRELTKTWLTVYFPAAQFFFFAPSELVVHTASAPEALVPAIRATIRAQEPHVAFERVATMDTLLDREMSRPRTAFAVTALFAAMAILLAAVGVYSVMSYEVTQRRYELAVRSALGASPARLFKGIVWQSLLLAVAGASIGIVAASWVTRSLASLLFEVQPGDAAIVVVGAGVLLAVVLVASSLPARRAANANPATLLRTE